MMEEYPWSYWNQKWYDYVGHQHCPFCSFIHFVARRRDDERSITKGRVVVETPRGWMCVCCYSEWDWNGPLENNEEERKKIISELSGRAERLGTPYPVKPESPFDTHSCRFLLEDKNCELEPYICEYTTLSQKCGLLIHDKYADMMESSEKRRREFRVTHKGRET